jgi:hypothetical protein
MPRCSQKRVRPVKRRRRHSSRSAARRHGMAARMGRGRQWADKTCDPGDAAACLHARPQRRCAAFTATARRDGDRSVPQHASAIRARARLAGRFASFACWLLRRGRIEFLSRHTRADAGMGGRALSPPPPCRSVRQRSGAFPVRITGGLSLSVVVYSIMIQ